jgi:nucleoid DNA-binding protein
MTKHDLVVRISQNTGISQKDTAQIVQMILDGIADEIVAGKTVEFRDFGVFKPAVWKRRPGRNPNKPEQTVIIPERTVVKFETGKELKKRVEKLDPKDI